MTIDHPCRIFSESRQASLEHLKGFISAAVQRIRCSHRTLLVRGLAISTHVAKLENTFRGQVHTAATSARATFPT